ncbi:MAG: DUF3034 family protein [Rhodocyclaceae bacterium]|nr:MAG: DUF3034 family protein [Rhodocyclaceae bacterium]
MKRILVGRIARRILAASTLLAAMQGAAWAADVGGKLLLTGGVTQVEGAAGGGLTPWAVIGGYGDSNQIGGNASYTMVKTGDFRLDAWGALVGINDRVELSWEQQEFNTLEAGAKLGLGQNFTFRQDVLGVKVRVAGDAILEQDSWLPQIAVGVQQKTNNRGALVKLLGAKDSSGTDYYVSATKLMLEQSLLLNGTVRMTKANQLGILGFGGDRSNDYKAQTELSAAYLVSKSWAVGAEYRSKPDNLKFAKEDDWYDLFVAWAPTKNVSATLAYVNLGDIATIKKQQGVYASVQIGF